MIKNITVELSKKSDLFLKHLFVAWYSFHIIDVQPYNIYLFTFINSAICPHFNEQPILFYKRYLL